MVWGSMAGSNETPLMELWIKAIANEIAHTVQDFVGNGDVGLTPAYRATCALATHRVLFYDLLTDAWVRSNNEYNFDENYVYSKEWCAAKASANYIWWAYVDKGETKANRKAETEHIAMF